MTSDRPRDPASPGGAPPSFLRFVAWQAVLAGSVLAAFAVVTWRPGFLFWALILALLVTPFIWVIGSSISSGKVDRRCPRCGAEDGIVRLARDRELGLACRACGWRDEEEYRAGLEEFLD